MAVQPIHEEVHPPRLTLVPTDEVEVPSAPPEVPRPIVQRNWTFPAQEMTAVLAAISAIIAVRFILLVAVAIGGFLAWKALDAKDGWALAAAGMFYLGVIGPMAYLTIRKG